MTRKLCTPFLIALFFTISYINVSAISQEEKQTLQQLLSFNLEELMEVKFIPSKTAKHRNNGSHKSYFYKSFISREING